MSPSIWQLLNSQEKTKLNRLKRTMLEGSPKYHYNVGVIAAGVYNEFNIGQQFPLSRKYEPLDSCRIINNGDVDIAINFNSGAGDLYMVPAHTIRRVTREEVGGIWYLRVTNLDSVAAIAVNMVDIELWKAPEDADSVARRSL